MKKKGILCRIFNMFKTQCEEATPAPEPPAPAPAPAPPAPVPAPAPAPTAPTEKTETHKVAGVSFRQEAIMSLASENPEYSMTRREIIDDGRTDEWLYEFDFYPDTVELIPEPDNPEDPKAIKVVVDGQHIGYIKSGSCAHIHKLLKKGNILALGCEIAGGKSKRVQEEVDEWGNSKYNLEKRSLPFYATLSIKVAL